MPSLVYALAALAAPAAALASTKMFVGKNAGGAGPVDISASDAHRVLAHHVGLDAAVLPNWRPSSENEAADIWHHLPQDVVHYDASQLFEPPARGSRVIMTMHDVDDGTCVLDMSDTGVLPTSLKATHKIPSHASPLAESFDALAQLYANAANGVMHMWDMTKHAGATSLERLDIELERLQHIADAERLNLDSVLSMRLAALGEVKQEYGADSAVYRDAYAKMRATLARVLERIEHIAGADVAVVHTTTPPRHVRRAPAVSHGAQPLSDMLAAFHASNATLASASPGAANACHASREALFAATSRCSGRGDARETRQGGKMCFRCACKRSSEAGRTRTWTGAACEKEDFSSQTLLIIGTIAVLFVSTVFSIALLYREGTQELPGTLASVSLGPQ